jgi:DNA-binding Lrp family transcriptional regulator
MSLDKYKDDILRLINQNGAMGVNALSRELNIPLSTLQKYLHRQNYFKLNEYKKWDLPENVIGEVKSNSLVLMANVAENSILLLKSQLEEMLLSVNNALVPIETIRRGINSFSPSVADNKSGQSDIDPRLVNIHSMKGKLSDIFKKQRANIPEEYQTLLFNFDYVGLVLKEGDDYVKNFLESDIYELLVGKVQELTEDTIEILKVNQIEA